MSSYTTKPTIGNTEWFTHDRFGMFIHFGLYAMPARHEWVKKNEMLSDEHYDLYFKYFNPDLFNPKEWARAAKEAGMKYAVITAKHHEGFCLFDSAYTDYKITNTPFGRDLLREFADAFRNEGLRIGLYYSLLDWNHPDFTIDMLHPRRTDADAQQKNIGKNMHNYAEYMRNQITELLTNYGDIDILWFDNSYTYMQAPDYAPWMKGKGKDDWEAEKLIETARKLRHEIIINDRTEIEQDLWTPEQVQPLSWIKHPQTGELVTWETCQTFSGSWGYFRDEMTWKSPEMLIQLLIKTVSIGGNLLMNVGPTARGYFDSRAEKALNVYAEWMKYHSRSIYGCTMAEPEFAVPEGCRLTQSTDGKRLYVHVFEYPYKHLKLSGYAGKIDYAQFLHDGSELEFASAAELADPNGFSDFLDNKDNAVVIKLPDVKPDVIVPVIEIFLK